MELHSVYFTLQGYILHDTLEVHRCTDRSPNSTYQIDALRLETEQTIRQQFTLLDQSKEQLDAERAARLQSDAQVRSLQLKLACHDQLIDALGRKVVDLSAGLSDEAARRSLLLQANSNTAEPGAEPGAERWLVPATDLGRFFGLELNDVRYGPLIRQGVFNSSGSPDVIELDVVLLRLVVGEYTATTSYYFLLLLASPARV